MQIINKIKSLFSSKRKIFSVVTLFIVSSLVVSCNLPQKQSQIINTPELTDSEPIEIENEDTVEIDPTVIKAQNFAARFLTGIARETFRSPLSLQISNVWFYEPIKNYDHYYFTFQFLELGNYVYYCNDMPIWDLDDVDEYIDRVHNDHVLQKYSGIYDSHVFDKCTNDAMSKGIPLDAEAIQAYFLVNYR